MSPITRRQLLGAALSSTGILHSEQSQGRAELRSQGKQHPKQRRILYFNDARHYYLYAFEPPMSLEDAWRPIDEIVGTSINTFVYGVESNSGLFNDTKVGVRSGINERPFVEGYYWRAWNNMQSLIDRGLDPLQVLIDRAHERGLDFITSMRIGGEPRDPRYRIGVGQVSADGGGAGENNPDFAHREVRALRQAWLEELSGYPVEGIELDFAFTPYYFKPQDVEANTRIMTDFVASLAQMIRRQDRDRIVGARVFPHEMTNLASGLDVRSWLSEGLVDYVAPLFYGYFLLDPNLPLEWLVEAAHGSGAEVYPMLHPFFVKRPDHATPAMIRAAAANYWAQGADGLMVGPWFSWPLRETEKSFLTELGDSEVIQQKDKHYFVSVRQEAMAALGYDHPLPLRLEKADPNFRGKIPFYLADDLSRKGAARVRLLMRVLNLVDADRLEVRLNGVSLRQERLQRTSHRYEFLWLEYELVSRRPKTGWNQLEVALETRPKGLVGGVTVDHVELFVEYDQPKAYADRPQLL